VNEWKLAQRWVDRLDAHHDEPQWVALPALG
jgi:hypothetical protein